MVTMQNIDDYKMLALRSFLESVSKSGELNEDNIVEAQALMDMLGISDVLDNAKNVYKDVKSRLPTEEQRAQIIDIAQRLLSVTDSFMHSTAIGRMFTPLNMEDTNESFNTIVYCLFVGVMTKEFLSKRTRWDFFMFILGCLSWKYILGVEISKIPATFRKMFSDFDISKIPDYLMSLITGTFRGDPVEAQIFGDLDLNLDEIVDTFAASISSVSILKRITGNHRVSLIKDIGDIMRIKNGIPAVLTNIVSLFEKIKSYLYRSKMSGYAARINSQGNPIIDKFIDDFEEIRMEQRNGKLAMTVQNYSRLSAILHQGEKIFTSLSRTSRNANLCTHLQQNINYIRKLVLEFEKMNLAIAGFKMEPVCAMMKGVPGTMKSHLAKHIAYACVSIVHPDKDPDFIMENSEVYFFSRKAENGYWDRYQDKVVVTFFDDFGQMRDVAGNPDNEYMDFIRCVNSFENHLHMSSIEEKSNTFFRSPFVIATTNLNKFAPKSIISRDALERRFDFVIEVTIDKRFSKYNAKESKYEFNPDKFDKDEAGELIIVPEAFRFGLQRKDKESGDYKTFRFVNFGGLVGLFKDLYLRKVSRFKTHTAMFKRTLEKYGEYKPPEESSEDLIMEDVVESQMDTSVPGAFPRHILLESTQTFRETATERGQSYASYVANMEEHNRLVNFCMNFLKRQGIDNPRDLFHDLVRDFNEDHVMDLLEFHPQLSYINDNFDWRYVLCIMYAQIPLFQSYAKSFDINILRELKLTVAYMILPDSPVVDANFMGHVDTIQLRREIDSISSDFVAAVKDFMTSYYKPILMFSVAFGFLYLSKKVISNFVGIDLDKPISQFMGYDSSKSVAKNKKVVFTAKTLTRNVKSTNKVESQGGMNLVAETHNTLRKRNVFSIHLQVKPLVDEYKQIGYATFIVDNCCIIPAHFVYMWNEEGIHDEKMYNRQVKFVDDNGTFRCSVDLKQIVENVLCIDEMTQNDYVCTRIPGFNSVRDISHMLLKTEDIEKFSKVFPVSVFDKKIGLLRETDAFLQTTTTDVILNAGIAYEVIRCLKYSMESEKGWCGLPIMMSINNKPKIVGIHIAGKRKTEVAYCSIVNADHVLEVTKDEFFKSDEANEIEFPDAQYGEECLKDNRFRIIGGEPNGNLHSPYGWTSIRASPLQSVGLVPSTGPALIQPTNSVNPYAKAISHYGKSQRNSDSDAVDKAFFDLQSMIEYRSSDRTRSVYSLEVALWGNPEDPYFSAMKSSSSSGYPMKYDKYDLKKELFKEGAPRDASNVAFKVMQDLVNFVIEQATLGRRMLWVYTDNLKDERRILAKILSGSSRLYNGCPLVYFATSRMYFGDFMANCVEVRLDYGMALGINALGAEWNDIAQRLLKYDCMGDGDFSKFDASELSFFHWKILDIINDWYNDGAVNRRIREVLWSDLVNSRHICHDLIYEWQGSLPSGNPFTPIVNSMYNLFSFRYCYYRNAPPTWFHAFDTCVQLFVLGDDNVYSFWSVIKDWFNEETICATMQELGLTMTSASKNDVSTLSRSLEDLSFLKRKFVYEKMVGRYIGPLDIDSVKEIPLWTKKGSQKTKIFVDNVEEYLCELSLHPYAVFEKGRNTLREAIKDLKMQDYFPYINESRYFFMNKRLNDIDE